MITITKTNTKTKTLTKTITKIKTKMIKIITLITITIITGEMYDTEIYMY